MCSEGSNYGTTPRLHDLALKSDLSDKDRYTSCAVSESRVVRFKRGPVACDLFVQEPRCRTYYKLMRFPLPTVVFYFGTLTPTNME